MSEVGIAHQNKYDIDQPDIVDFLVNDFSSTLHKWRDLYPTGLLIFAKHIGYGTLGYGTLDDLNTPIYTIPKYFIGISSNTNKILRSVRLAPVCPCSSRTGAPHFFGNNVF